MLILNCLVSLFLCKSLFPPRIKYKDKRDSINEILKQEKHAKKPCANLIARVASLRVAKKKNINDMIFVKVKAKHFYKPDVCDCARSYEPHDPETHSPLIVRLVAIGENESYGNDCV